MPLLLLLLFPAADCREQAVTVHIPDRGGDSGRPRGLNTGPRVAASLCRHGQTRQLMDIEIVAHPELDREYPVIKVLFS